MNEDYQDQVPLANPKLEIMGLISMIVSIVGLPFGFCCSIFGLPFAIAGIVLALLSLKKIKEAPDQFSGKGFAIAGLILSIILTLLCIGMFILGLVMQTQNKAMWQEIIQKMQQNRH